MSENKNKKYRVVVQCLVPATIEYVVETETPQEALSRVEQFSLVPDRKIYGKNIKRKINAQVYEDGFLTIKHVKNY